MELTKNQVSMTKGVAILFMLLLHLFCTKNYIGLFQPTVMIGDTPLIYYFALFGDCCVAMYCFCSGYGLMSSYDKDTVGYKKNNLMRIFKLYLNFWIILIVFVLIIGPLLGMRNHYPGSFKAFILTLTAIDPAYNGAWWFLTTYILLVLTSPYLNKSIKKYHPIIILGVSGIFYFIAYVQRIKGVLQLDLEWLNWLIRQVALYGTSQLPYVVGILFCHYKWYSKLNVFYQKLKFRNAFGISIIILMLIGHGIVQTLFVAPFIGITFICIFNFLSKPSWLEKVFLYFGKHSTNLWLIHMFFYMIYFKELVFAPKYPILIFTWLIILCLISSHVINFFYHPLLRTLDHFTKKRIGFENKSYKLKSVE